MRDQKAIDYFSNEVILAKINAEVDSMLARKYNISGYPTSVLVDKDGNEIDRIVGYMEVDEFLQTIRDYKQGIGTLEDLLVKIEANFDRTMAFDIGEKYKYRGGQEDALGWFAKVIDAGEPLDSLSGESRMAVADTYYRAKDYKTAVTNYDKIAEEFKAKPQAEQAYVWGAYITMKDADTTNAISRFEKFIEMYPESEDVEFAQKKINELKGIVTETEG